MGKGLYLPLRRLKEQGRYHGMNERFDIEKFNRDAVPARKFAQVTQELINEEYPFPAGHEAQLRRDRDWFALAHQVVGAEVD